MAIKQVLIACRFVSENTVNRLENFLSSVLTGDVLHCEIVFNFDNQDPLACVIWEDHDCQLRPRNWGDPNWRYVELPLSTNEKQLLFTWCKQQSRKCTTECYAKEKYHSTPATTGWFNYSAPTIPSIRCRNPNHELGKLFNKSGYYRAITPFPRKTDHTRYFCSELTVAAFQSIGYFKDLNPCSTTPSDLYNYLLDKGYRFSPSPRWKERSKKAKQTRNNQHYDNKRKHIRNNNHSNSNGHGRDIPVKQLKVIPLQMV